uniref:Uncharacterized protein n=1 Tax=Anguilla anguilla TaxID=7936 RepID=A0A0E9S860_ANGAN
MNGRRFGC